MRIQRPAVCGLSLWVALLIAICAAMSAQSLAVVESPGFRQLPIAPDDPDAGPAFWHHDVVDFIAGASTPRCADEGEFEWTPAFRVHPPGSALRAGAEFILTGSDPEGDTPSEVVFTPDGAEVIIAHRDSGNLTIFDAATRLVTGTITLSGSPNGLDVSSDGRWAVTGNIFEDTASIVDLDAGVEVAVLSIGDQPSTVRISPDGSTAVVGNTMDSTLSVIDLVTHAETIRLSDAPFSGSVSVTFENGAITFTFTSFEIAADNRTLIFPDRFGARIQFFDIVAGTTNSVGSADNPASVAVTPDGVTAVVGHESTTRRVSVINVSTQSITKTIPTRADLRDGTIAIQPDGSKAIVAVQNAARVVNLVTDAVSADLDTACCLDLTTTADGNYCFAGGFRGSLISYASESIVANLNNVLSATLTAVSPTGPRAASVANIFGEQMLVFNTNGGGGFLEGIVPTGDPPEGDKAHVVAVSSDSGTAVVTNILSDNATIVDVAGRSVVDIVGVGDRPSGVEITPDGGLAVVANLDSSFASIIDLTTRSVTNINISRRAGEVEISPDGRYAYLAVVADGDGVWRIDLDAMSVAGPKVLTGNMSGIGFLFNQTSGMTLSHDGSTLVTCGSFTDDLSVIDTGTWTEVARVGVGDFPVRAIFSNDDSTIYVTNRDSDTVSVLANAGGGSGVVDTINVGDRPFDMTLAPDESKLYVSSSDAEFKAQVQIIELPGNTVGLTIPLTDLLAGLHASADGQRLYASVGTWSVRIGPGPAREITQSGDFYVLDAQTGDVLDRIETGIPPSTMITDLPETLALIPSPFGDGLSLIRLAPPCTGRERLKLRCRPGQNETVTVKAKVRRSQPGATLTFRVDEDGSTDKTAQVNDDGVAKTKFRRLDMGQHRVEVLECGADRSIDCS